ncbi:biopolymer transporter ExbD [Rhodobacter sp. ETT8]|uniref:Biopolymer transporter ExbD n=2 Tax=Pseudotabrizicola algicola TaxID=2709381 RepID=A0A6B3RQQ0_9RHOB|nr:biopolymer transporter ExbD [Pseudotabrizicola algicola]NEX45402.1 biopolymer transporter ExbD [Pseudotabrizicola algicola]
MRLTPPARQKSEPTITLINVVFLMLIFFLVAGQVAAPVDRNIRLIDAASVSSRAPDDALAIRADGTTLWRGVVTSPEAFAAARLAEGSEVLRLVPARDLPAQDLLHLASTLRAAGAAEVRLVTERSTP